MGYYLLDPTKVKGGLFYISDGFVNDGKLVKTTPAANQLEIVPKDDRLVIFASNVTHCVMPTISSTKFEDGRFSVQIWMGKQ